MSQAGVISNSGGGGGGDLNSLTPDSGGVVNAIGGTIQVLGQKAGIVETMQTYNGGSNILNVANQTWQTQYVVDASTTNGLKGTFTTIQSAIDQAVLDGASSSNWKKILVRSGLYFEDITLDTGIIIEGCGFSYPGLSGLDPPLIGTIISGTHSVNVNGCEMAFKDVCFSNNEDNLLFDIDQGTAYLNFNSCCFFSNSTNTPIFQCEYSAPQMRIVFSECTISTNAALPVYDFIFSNNSGAGLITFLDCLFGDSPPSTIITSFPTDIKISGNIGLYIDNCIGINSINTNDTAYLECYDTTFVSSINREADYFISGSGLGGYLSDCDFGSFTQFISAFPSSGYAIEYTTGPWVISNLTSYGGLLYEDDTEVNEGQSTQGDVLQVYGSSSNSISMSINDYYLGLENTSIPVVVTVPSLVTKGKSFIIKDEDGSLPVIDVTIQSDDLGCLIDNQPFIKMTAPLSSVKLVKRRGNFYSI